MIQGSVSIDRQSARARNNIRGTGAQRESGDGRIIRPHRQRGRTADRQGTRADGAVDPHGEGAGADGGGAGVASGAIKGEGAGTDLGQATGSAVTDAVRKRDAISVGIQRATAGAEGDRLGGRVAGEAAAGRTQLQCAAEEFQGPGAQHADIRNPQRSLVEIDVGERVAGAGKDKRTSAGLDERGGGRERGGDGQRACGGGDVNGVVARGPGRRDTGYAGGNAMAAVSCGKDSA